MSKLALPLAFATILLVAAGCGGGGKSAAGPAATAQAGSGGGPYSVDKTAVCLTDENWIFQPESNRIDATSPGGVPVVIRFYPSAAAAKAQGAGKKKEVFGNAVVTYQQTGREQFTSQATAAEITAATKTIKKCLR